MLLQTLDKARIRFQWRDLYHFMKLVPPPSTFNYYGFLITSISRIKRDEIKKKCKKIGDHDFDP